MFTGAQEKVTLRRPKVGTLQMAGQSQIEEVLDSDGSQLHLWVTIERRGRRVTDAKGVEVQTDGTLLFVVVPKPEVRIGDIAVTADGRAWRVIRLETQKARFGKIEYGRADVQRTELAVPKDKHA